jgi:hypothetical protein
MDIMRSFLGMVVLLAIAFLLSVNKKAHQLTHRGRGTAAANRYRRDYALLPAWQMAG